MREKFTQRKWATAPATLLLILAMGMSGGLFGCSSREISSDSSLPTETSRDAVQYSALPIAQAEPRECFDVPSYLQKTAFVGEKVVIGKIVPVEEKAKDVRSYVVNGNEVVQRGEYSIRSKKESINVYLSTHSRKNVIDIPIMWRLR